VAAFRREKRRRRRKRKKKNYTQEEHTYTYTIFFSLFRMTNDTCRACTFVVITRRVENRADSLFGPVVDFFREAGRKEKKEREREREREREHGSHGSLDGFDGCFDINPASRRFGVSRFGRSCGISPSRISLDRILQGKPGNYPLGVSSGYSGAPERLARSRLARTC